MTNLNMRRSTSNRFDGKHMLSAIVLLSMIVAGTLVWQYQPKTCVDASSIELPSMTLTVVAPTGAQVVLNETNIGNMPSYRAYGGYKNQLGYLKGLGNYTGVSINDFCNLVGGIGSGYSVYMIAVDGYSKKMSYEELNGALVTYDNVTGEEVQHNQTLIPMLAYHYNDANLSSSDGPLRVAIVGPEGLCTQSTYWVKQVVRLELHANLQPMNLTLVAVNGTEVLVDETDISLLPAVRGTGAYRNQLGIVKNLGNYTGPSLNTLCDLIGGMEDDNLLRITAVDGYNKTFSYEEVNGAFAAYDNVTGDPVQNNQTLTPILAYHFNDVNFSLSDGPLKSAIVGPEELATSSAYWVKQVVKLEILPVPITLAMTVEPAAYHAISVNETFSIDIYVQNVTENMNLVGFEFKLFYNTTLLEIVNVENGTFLESFAAVPNGGMLYYGPYFETDYVLFAGLILPDINGVWHSPFPDGEGTVAKITFRAKYQPIGLDQPIAGCALALDDTKLANVEAEMIAHNAYSGYYDIVPTPTGDLNFDGIVDIYDAIFFANSFGSTPSDPQWSYLADLNDDGVIDIYDAILLANHFGEQRANL